MFAGIVLVGSYQVRNDKRMLQAQPRKNVSIVSIFIGILILIATFFLGYFFDTIIMGAFSSDAGTSFAGYASLVIPYLFLALTSSFANNLIKGKTVAFPTAKLWHLFIIIPCLLVAFSAFIYTQVRVIQTLNESGQYKVDQGQLWVVYIILMVLSYSTSFIAPFIKKMITQNKYNVY